MIRLAALIIIVILDTPTPTPTPSPTPTSTPGPGNNPVVSFYVPPQEPPWAVPVLPTWGTGTPQPTLYASTPQHGTDYPNQMGTATAQIGVFSDPLSGISTPIAALIQSGPTPEEGDINTGMDPLGTGPITLSQIGEEIDSGIVDVVGTAKGFVTQVADMVSYSPWLAPLPLIVVIPPIVGMFLSLIFLIVRGASFLSNFLSKILLIAGTWKP